jgi:general secretion pathway protein E
MEKPKDSNSPNKLTLAEFLRMLVSAGKIDKSQAETLYNDCKLDTSNLHPIIIVAKQKWDDLLTEKTMTADSLVSHGN